MEKELLRRAYIDYKQLERQFLKDIGINENDIKKVYEYLQNIKDVDVITFDLIEKYIDFNYKDMTLTISCYNKRNVCLLCEYIELWTDKEGYLLIGIDFEDLEKKVLSY